MLEQTWELRPIKVKNWCEQILVVDPESQYPFALVHIDSFYPGKNHTEKEIEIYDLLDSGETVMINVKMIINEDI
jgi:hypothetical protein